MQQKQLDKLAVLFDAQVKMVDSQRGDSSEAAFMTVELFILKTNYRQVVDEMI